MSVNIYNVSGWVTPFTEEEILNSFGFIYLIRNLKTGLWYIGKKQTKRKITRPPLKGKKRRRIEYKESDWRTYWSSSEKLQAHILSEGHDSFQRIILAICDTKIDLSYSEVECQVLLNAIASDKSFNGVLGATSFGSLHSGIKRKGLDWITSVHRVSPEVFYDSPVVRGLIDVLNVNAPEVTTENGEDETTNHYQSDDTMEHDVSSLVDSF